MKGFNFGDYVKTSNHGYTGRVMSTQRMGSGDEAWMDGQTIRVTDEQRVGWWVNILVHEGGAVVAPLDTVQHIAPFEFVNRDAEETFGALDKPRFADGPKPHDSLIGGMTLGQLTTVIAGLIAADRLDRADLDGLTPIPPEPDVLHNYMVKWEIDIDDSLSPKDAAHSAYMKMRGPCSTATVFDVKNKSTSESIEIDLQDDYWIPDSHWDNHVEYTPADWMREVGEGDTRLGYLAWVNAHIDMGAGFQDPNR